MSLAEVCIFFFTTKTSEAKQSDFNKVTTRTWQSSISKKIIVGISHIKKFSYWCVNNKIYKLDFLEMCNNEKKIH